MGNKPQLSQTRKKYDIFINRITPTGIIAISFVSGIFIWIIDSVLDYIIFYSNQGSFIDIFISDVPAHELYIRLLILTVFLIFGIIISLHFSSRMKAEGELMKNEKNLRTTLNSIGDAVIATDVNGIITRMNPVAEYLTGCSEMEAIGKQLSRVFNIVNEVTNKKVEDPVSKVLKFGRIVHLTNHTLLISKNGNRIPIADSGAPILDDSGKINGVVLVFRDQSKERLARQLLETRLEFVEYANSHSIKELTSYIINEVCSKVKSQDGYFHFIDFSIFQKSEILIADNSELQIDDLVTEKNSDPFKNIKEIGDWAKCIKHSKAVIINKIDLKDSNIKRVLTVPVVRNNQTVALLSLINKENDYSEQDVEIASYLADITWDIVRHKRTEEELRESEMKYRNVFESARDAIMILEGEKFIACNNAAFKMYGCQNEKEFIGLGPYDFSPRTQPNGKKSKEKAINMINEAFLGKEQLFYWQHIRKNGEYFDAEISLNRFRLNEKYYLQAIARDISLNKQAEEALRISEERYRQLAETTPDIILLLDLHGRIKYVNSAWTNITGYSSENIIGKLVTDYISIEGDGQMISLDIDPKIQIKKTFLYKTEIVDKKGIKIPVEINSTPLFTKGTVDEVLIVIHDISEQIRNEKELITAKEKAEESDRLKSAFLANMSHEIRTPMNGILGFSDLLKQPNLSSNERLQYVDVIEKSGKRMLNIINDLIDISKIEAGQMEVIISEVNLNEQFEYLYSFFKPEAEKLGLKLTCNVELPDDKCIIFSDREKLIAVLINVIKNAIKYTNKGSVDFGYAKKGNDIEFYVRDTGIGIAKKRQQAVFERFVQADLSISQPYEGAGLGLAIAKGYVELLNGKIWLESEKNIGTKFYISLPIQTNMEVLN